MPSPSTTSHSPTYYEILNLSPATISSHDDPASFIKRAYRRALLAHHPDKTKNPHQEEQQQQQQTDPQHKSHARPSSPRFTIDQISAAYATLSRPAQRAAYDRSLAHHRHRHLSLSQSPQSAASSCFPSADLFQTGIETVDLDDLDCDDGAGGETTRWYRACRCGNARGYQFGEADLEEAAEVGGLMVGCADCSLWLRVHFAVVEDGEGDAGEGNGGIVGD